MKTSVEIESFFAIEEHFDQINKIRKVTTSNNHNRHHREYSHRFTGRGFISGRPHHLSPQIAHMCNREIPARRH